MAIAKECNLYVIEDNAQAMGELIVVHSIGPKESGNSVHECYLVFPL
jgi:dTDP-4-amino-4,6-dideoxygalactose transaminase